MTFDQMLMGLLTVLTGAFVPLALVVLAPIVINIFLYDVLIAHELAFGIPLLVLNTIALYPHRQAYLPMIRKQEVVG